MQELSNDRRSADGTTLDMIAGLVTACRVLRTRDLSTPAVRAALADLAADPDLAALLRAAQAPAESWYEAHSTQVQGLSSRVTEIWEAQRSLADQISDLVETVQRLNRRIDHATGACVR